MPDINDFLIEQFKELKKDIKDDLRVTREETLTQTKSIEEKLDNNSDRLIVLETHIRNFQEYTEKRLTSLENKTKETSDSFDIIKITFEVLNRQFNTLKNEYDLLIKKTFGESKDGEENTIVEKLSLTKESMNKISIRLTDIEESLKKIVGNNVSVQEMYDYYVANKFYNNYIIKILMKVHKYRVQIINKISKIIDSLLGKILLILLSGFIGGELGKFLIELFKGS